MMEVGAEESLGGCNSKMTCKSALFWCLTTATGCDDTDELAVVVSAEGCKTTLLKGVVLIQTCTASFMGLVESCEHEFEELFGWKWLIFELFG